MRRWVAFGAALAGGLVAACSNSVGPSFFPIGGTYTGTITYQMSGDPGFAAPLVPGITLELNDPDGNGNFSGNFAFNQGFTATGNIAGQFSSDGSTIDFTQFGDSSQPVFYVGTFLVNNYGLCNFKGSTFTLDPNGGFDGNGNFDMDGTFTGIRCASADTDSLTTSLAVSLAVFNPNPEAVKKALGLKPLLGGPKQVH